MRDEISVGDVIKLDISERIQFVEDVWDSIAMVPESVSLTDKQKEELDRRLEACHKTPSLGSPWSQIKKRILSDQ